MVDVSRTCAAAIAPASSAIHTAAAMIANSIGRVTSRASRDRGVDRLSDCNRDVDHAAWDTVGRRICARLRSMVRAATGMLQTVEVAV